MSQSRWRLLVAVLWVAVLGSALGVVYGKQEARNRFSELQKHTTARDDLDIEWGQLQLEQSAWSTHAFVENVAATRLRMSIPDAAAIEVVLDVGLAQRHARRAAVDHAADRRTVALA